jgi:type IV secretory pathway VirB10-like protein
MQPFWKAQIIKLLRGTIGALEGAVEKLETEPAPGSKQTPGFWGGILGKIRSFLPENLSAKLSDTALTGIIAAISVILIWTTSTLLTNKPAEVATVPQVEETPSPTITTPPAEIIPEPQPPVEITPPAAEIPPPEPEPTPEPTPEPEPTPTPTPILELTPEQQLIAAIQNQVGEISDRFASGLIKSIQANFSTSNLTVKITDDWYTLKQSEQDKLAADILQRSKELDFSHLEITDSQDELVARNPVVGTEMVIFKRKI